MTSVADFMCKNLFEKDDDYDKKMQKQYNERIQRVHDALANLSDHAEDLRFFEGMNGVCDVLPVHVDPELLKLLFPYRLDIPRRNSNAGKKKLKTKKERNAAKKKAALLRKKFLKI